QGFEAIGFLVGTGEGDVANLQQFRRGEKDHVGRIVKERVHQAALIDQYGRKSGALGLDGRRHASGAGSDYQNIKRIRQGGHGYVHSKCWSWIPCSSLRDDVCLKGFASKSLP